ncbi:MAG TPA: GNAT family N-acetyltransferase [Polyangia bacterium]|nr:GNAT family N-acetyltransferase [Polyangia bacterium]
MHIRPLESTTLDDALALCRSTLEWDPFAPRVLEEKLFGGDAGRPSLVLGAYDQGALVGLLAGAGRWIKLLMVAREHRRRGVGTALLAEMVAWAQLGARLRAADHPGNYLTPGIDPRYQDGRGFLLARGFVEVGQVPNLRVRLRDNQRATRAHAIELERPCATAGYKVRRAAAADGRALDQMVTAAFSRAQAWEIARALEVGGVHIALDDGGALAAFAAHDGNNRGLGWFGPAGTLPQHQRRGLGECLLVHCLADVAERGQDETIIAWVGPIEFYRRAVGAEIERTFTQWERPA